MKCVSCSKILDHNDSGDYISLDFYNRKGPYCSLCYDLKLKSCSLCHKVVSTHIVFSLFSLTYYCDSCFDDLLKKHSSCFTCHTPFTKDTKIYLFLNTPYCSSCYDKLNKYPYGVS